MMDRILSLEESRALWSIRDFPNHMAAGAGNITCDRSKVLGLDVFWESESESQVVVSEADFAPLEDTSTPPPAGPQPPSIQHKIKSLLLDIDSRVGPRILVQFWAPIRTASGQIMLTASHQPFGIGDGLYEGLCRFRNYCAEHQYGVSVEDTTLLGPPGRVFTLGSPELCPDVGYYSHEEFPLKKHALDCGIRYYASVPLFERDGQCCVGVLELSSLDECFFRALKVVPLEKYDLEHQVHRCKWDKTPPSFTPKTRQTIHSLAQFVKGKHRLRLVQVWVPCLCHVAPDATSLGKYDAHNSCSSSNPASPTRITRLFRDYYTPSDFRKTDDVPRLEPLWVRNYTSLVGRAYSQKKPCFVPDFSQFNIFDCPLLPLIRWFKLKACFAIPLQLIDPQFDPFVLEVFFPRRQNCDRNLEAIQSLLFTLKEKCSTDQVQVEKFSVKLSHSDSDNIAYLDVYQNGSSDATAQKRLNDHPNTTGETAMASSSRGLEVSPNAAEADRIQMNGSSSDATARKRDYSGLNDHPNTTGDTAMASSSRGVEVSPNAAEADHIQINGSSDGTARKRDYSRLNDHPNATGDKAKTRCSREVEVSPYAARAEITLDDITQYFGLKLNDAAEKLGVSRSTLKRRRKDLGIKRWPSHRRKNVHRIQSSPRSPTRFVEGGSEVIKESEIEPPCPNNNQTERHAAASDTIPKSAKGKNITARDEMDLDHSYTMIVKATYMDDTVKFPLGSNSGIEELRRELCKRFEFKAERFKIKYADEGDWIFVSCDEDLRFRMDDLKSSGQTRMNVSIFPATL